MRTNKKLNEFNQRLKRALVEEQRSFIALNFLGLEQLLENYYRDGAITGYKIHNNTKQVEIFILIDSAGRMGPIRIQNFAKASLVVTGRLPALRAEIKDWHHATSIVRTAKYGLVSSRFAVAKKTGGYFLSRII